MAFSIDCSCGKQLSVSATQAGCELPCECGLVLGIPSLGEMNRGVTTPTTIAQAGAAVPLRTAGATKRDGQTPARNECPYCGAIMQRGAILGDRYKLKWLPEDVKLVLGIWAFDAEPIGQKEPLSRPRVDGMKCESCRKMVVDY